MANKNFEGGKKIDKLVPNRPWIGFKGQDLDRWKKNGESNIDKAKGTK